MTDAIAEYVPTARKMRVADITPLNIPFADLIDGACKYETSNAADARDYRFCGHPAFGDLPYCAAHAAIAYQPSPRT